MKFYVITKINRREYVAAVDAENAGRAEHVFLDRAICAANTYSVLGCTAFGPDDMPYFAPYAADAETVSVSGLFDIIDAENARLTGIENAEKAIAAAAADVTAAKQQLAAAKQQLAALKNA